MRLQKYLAHCGVASRRKSELLISGGRVRVNSVVVTELGTKIDPTRAKVEVDGKRVVLAKRTWLLLHKPPNCITSTLDPEGRETVMNLVQRENIPGLFPVGRLDYATSGVLLLTNDGDRANLLMHPRNQIPRTYHVKVAGAVSDESIQKLNGQVLLQKEHTSVRALTTRLARTRANDWLEITIYQGINHQIHKMIAEIETKVRKLIRVSFAGIRADDLRPGKYRELKSRELEAIAKHCKSKK